MAAILNIAKNRYKKIFLFLLLILFVSILKSGSIFNYSMFSIDEERIVEYAVGFLGFDFNPRWFGYHTFPMYILSFLYFIIFSIYYLFGIVSSRVEFVSMLFSNDAVFFISGRILFSLAYTMGCFILSFILYKKFSSKIGVVAFFIVVNIMPDALHASNYIRADNFIFLFLALTVYFSCFAPKRASSFLLSIAFCAAAFTSKFPAIILFPILFLSVAVDIYRGNYPKKYLLYFIILSPLLIFIFMPYMVLDFSSYKPVIKQVISRSSGEFTHIGKVHYYDTWNRLYAMYNLIIAQTRVLSIIGATLFAINVLIWQRNLIFSVLFVFSYIVLYATSLTIDSYWLRPVYPFFIFFTVALFISVDNLRVVEKVHTFLRRKDLHNRLFVFGKYSIFLVLIIYYVVTFKDNIFNNKIVKYYFDFKPSIDTRIVASEWIQNNLPEHSTIWLDGHIPLYSPFVFSKEKIINLHLKGFNGISSKNQIMNAGYEYFYFQYRDKYKTFNVGLLGMGNLEKHFFDRLKMLKKGDYVVINSYIYNRYYNDKAMVSFPEIASESMGYYAILRKQQHVKIFTGRGPAIDIYRIKDNPENLVTGLNKTLKVVNGKT